MNGRPWTANDLRLLCQMYPHQKTHEVAAKLRRSESSVYRRAAELGVQKSAEFIASPQSGRLHKGETRPGSEAFQFRSGHVPANKGLRRPGWAPGRMKETQFRKGERSGIAAGNWRPIGTILTDPEGYRRIKIREAVYGKEPTGFGNSEVWPFLHRHLWEQHRGPIPPGHLIAFKDKNRAHCVIDNLECITRAELAARNRMWTIYPREMAEAIQLHGQLKRKLRNMESTNAAK